MSTGARRWPGAGHWPAVQHWMARTLADGVTDPAPSLPRWRRVGSIDLAFGADLLVAAIGLGTTASVLATANSRHGSRYGAWMLFVVSLVTVAPVLLRTRFPLTAWAGSTLGTFWVADVIPPRSMGLPPYPPAGVLVYILCLYAVAVRCRAWVVAAAGVVTVMGAVIVDPRTAGSALVGTLPLLVGLIVRTRRRGREELAVQERRHEGERAFLEERQRIARELHDIVAHHMSVIAIQAEAGPYKVANPPPELTESFADIRASALSGLTELRRLLGVLRNGEPETVPQPGLGELDRLLASARNGGIAVTAAIGGTPVALSPGVDLSAYRILQEALSNAMRHAPGATVSVRLSYQDIGLLLQVRNDRCPQGAPGNQPPAAGGGHGIVGMHERAAMVGGKLSAAPTPAGGFAVTAFLPFDNDTTVTP